MKREQVKIQEGHNTRAGNHPIRILMKAFKQLPIKMQIKSIQMSIPIQVKPSTTTMNFRGASRQRDSGTCEYHVVCKMSKYISNEQAKPPTNKEKSSFPHLRRITHLYEGMQPPTNHKNGAQIAHDVKKLLKELHCHFIED